ncbi:MAG: hypothetical protein ACI37Z_03395 [Candidatus Gastranaerophilaceae bacterium]
MSKNKKKKTNNEKAKNTQNNDFVSVEEAKIFTQAALSSQNRWLKDNEKSSDLFKKTKKNNIKKHRVEFKTLLSVAVIISFLLAFSSAISAYNKVPVKVRDYNNHYVYLTLSEAVKNKLNPPEELGSYENTPKNNTFSVQAPENWGCYENVSTDNASIQRFYYGHEYVNIVKYSIPNINIDTEEYDYLLETDEKEIYQKDGEYKVIVRLESGVYIIDSNSTLEIIDEFIKNIN